MYTLNYETDSFTEANMTCRQIEEPNDGTVGFNYTEEEVELRAKNYEVMALMPDLVHGESKYNIDSKCNFGEESTLFIDGAREEFLQYF